MVILKLKINFQETFVLNTLPLKKLLLKIHSTFLFSIAFTFAQILEIDVREKN